MKKLKYIKFDTKLSDSVFLFPAWENHANVAFKLGYTPVSAGFVHITVTDDQTFRVITYGHSASLNLQSDAADAELILDMLNNS